MKKLLFIFAAAAMLFACNKNTGTEPTTNPTTQKEDTVKPSTQDTVFATNFISDQFKELLPLVGLQKSAAESALVQAGWVNYQQSGVYVKFTNFSCSQVSLFTNSSTNTVYSTTCSIFPDTTTVGAANYKPQMYSKFIHDAVKRIGNGFEMGSAKTSCNFFATYNGLTKGIMARNCSEFEKVMTDTYLNGSFTYYLESSITSWNLDNPGTFIGVSMVLGYYPLPDVTVTEYTVAFDFKDERLK